MKRLVLIFAFMWGNATTASDPAPSWGAGWQAYVTNTYCELRREYYIPYKDDPDRRGFLSETAFNKAFVRFVANTRLHGDIIPKDSLGIIRFHLYVYPQDMPNAPPASKRIIEASLGGYRSEANLMTTADIHTFSLNADQSARLLQRFTDNEIVEFELTFANGDAKQFKIYPSGNRTFYVWANMFQTCIRSHEGKRS